MPVPARGHWAIHRLKDVAAKLDEIDRLLDEPGLAERLMERLDRTFRECVTVTDPSVQLTAHGEQPQEL